jgi:hypothetical protein
VRSTFVAALLGSGLCWGVSGCDAPRDARASAEATRAALVSSPAERIFSWGKGAGAFGFKPSVTERLALGPTAVAVDPAGRVLVLDALNGRVARIEESGAVVTLATVDHDADDLAVGPDGAIAVHHQTSTSIDVLDVDGRRIGALDAAIVRDVDTVSLGRSRQVSVTNAFQETYLLGSPSFPQTNAAVLHSKREGAALLVDRTGLSVVRRQDGVVELRRIAGPGDGETDRSRVLGRDELGKASSARLVGVTGWVACARVEGIDQGAAGEIAVRREAVCVDIERGVEVLRFALPSPGAYVPRRELAFAYGTLVHLHPEPEGARIMRWTVRGSR